MQQHEGSGYARHLSKYLLAVLTVAALSYCSPHPAPAVAADLSYGCLEGSTNSTCLASLTVKLNNEVLTAESGTTKLVWCNNQWVNSGINDSNCAVSGTIKVLNGEFKLQDLIDLNVKFKANGNPSWFCKLD